MEDIDWILEQKPLDDFPETDTSPDFDIINLKTKSVASENISPLIQFITLPAVLSDNMITTIPTSNLNVYHECMEKIAPNFSSVKGIITNASTHPNEMQLKNVIIPQRDILVKMLSENTLHPVVSDLYGDFTPRPRGVINSTKSYKIVSKKIEPYTGLDFTDAWNFLFQTYIKNYYVLSIVPTNWYLTNELRDSPALKFFNSMSENVFLFVDQPTKRVIGLDIFE